MFTNLRYVIIVQNSEKGIKTNHVDLRYTMLCI